jgi:hypothetical protein
MGSSQYSCKLGTKIRGTGNLNTDQGELHRQRTFPWELDCMLDARGYRSVQSSYEPWLQCKCGNANANSDVGDEERKVSRCLKKIFSKLISASLWNSLVGSFTFTSCGA